MTESTTTTLESDDIAEHPPSGRFSFLRAAAGFLLEDAPAGGVLTGAAHEPQAPKTETVEIVQLSPTTVPKRPATPLAHRLMVFALIPFVVIAISGLIVINRPSPRRQQPAPAAAPAASAVPADDFPSVPPPPPASPGTVVTTTTISPVPTTEAPRSRRTAPFPQKSVTQSTQPPPAATTPSTEAPPTTQEPATTTTEPTTTTTTNQPPTTTTTQPEPTNSQPTLSEPQ